MKTLLQSTALTLMAMTLLAASGFHEFTLKSIDGKPTNMAAYQGKVVLVVNVASQCGFTPQYAGLEKLYQTYKSRGLVIVGIPANNFGGQEPGSDAEIKQFCNRTYNVTFPMMSKVSVAGADKTPLYGWLTTRPNTKGEVQWNFTKFLIDRNGNAVARFESSVEPESAEIKAAIEQALGN